MDDRIFIRENDTDNSRNRYLIAAVIVVVVLGVLFVAAVVLANSFSRSNTAKTNTVSNDTNKAKETEKKDDQLIVDNSDNNDKDTAVIPDTTKDTDKDEDVDTDAPIDNSDEPVYAPPSDSSKINLYFPKSPQSDTNSNNQYPVLRDKPASAVVTYIITEVLRGPSSEERSSGYKSLWSFSGSANCAGSKSTFKYDTSGGILRLTMCKQFAGTDIKAYQRSLELAIKETGQAKGVMILDSTGSCLVGSNGASC